MASLAFIDCHVSFGLRKVVQPGTFHKKEDLLSRMADYGISQALVTHALAREFDPSAGNDVLMSDIADEPQLHPMWVLLPHHTSEFMEPERLLEEMRLQNVRAGTLLPSAQDYGFSLEEWSCGPLLRVMASHRVPLFIGYGQFESLGLIFDLCKRHPNLPLVLTDLNYRVNRVLYPLMEQLPNLYIETSGYVAQDGIETFCERFGSERILFGTGMPSLSGASAVTVVRYAALSTEDKCKIASENLLRIMDEVSFT